jgi:hypothetical protein
MNSTDANCSINVPGLWHNGDCSLLCRPTKWYDILTFFLGNYLAHVATVTSPPGASVARQAYNLLSALFCPISGFSLGIEAVASKAVFAPTSLQTAARAGALLMVVRSSAPDQTIAAVANPQGTQSRDEIELADVERNTPLAEAAPSPLIHRPWLSDNIHGHYALPQGYGLTYVPYDAEFEDDEEDTIIRHESSRSDRKCCGVLDIFRKRERTRADIACNYNGAKAIISIAQITFGIYTLYRTRGNQVQRFGYAAYGLTVTPYALMSILNLAGNLMRPNYPSMYIVRSKTLDELQSGRTSNIVSATVGRIKETSVTSLSQEYKKLSIELMQKCGYAPVLGVHLLAIGTMTKSCKGYSSLAQRVWIMFWLVIGGTFGLSGFLRPDPFHPRFEKGTPWDRVYLWEIFMIPTLLVSSVPAIGGFVVVAQMIKEYGVCERMLDVTI